MFRGVITLTGRPWSYDIRGILRTTENTFQIFIQWNMNNIHQYLRWFIFENDVQCDEEYVFLTFPNL